LGRKSSFGEKIEFSDEWQLVGKIPKDDQERLAFYDKLFMDAFMRKIKLEVIVKYSEAKDIFYVIKKKQIVTYDQKLG